VDVGSHDARVTKMLVAFIVLGVAAPVLAQVDPARADTAGWVVRPGARAGDFQVVRE
jgi:hypothetical protein